MTASEWLVEGSSFEVAANISDVLDQHGEGVYTIILWALIADKVSAISQVSIFYNLG